MDKNIEQLVNTSRYYGQNPDFVIAGGGNTSFKDAERIWIKASGVSMSDIDENGFVCLDRKKLEVVSQKQYSHEASAREQLVKEDMHKAILFPANKRPSVETSMHEIIRTPFVVHTHPTMVNGLLCAVDSKNAVTQLFGDEVLYVEYTDPGYVLFKAVAEGLEKFRAEKGKEPQIIFLENHGVFVGGNSTGEIDKIYLDIQARLTKAMVKLPQTRSMGDASVLKPAMDALRNSPSGSPLFMVPATDELSQMFVASRESFEPINKPFTPDNIVYCKSRYLFVEEDRDLPGAFKAFSEQFGYAPKIVGVKGKGILAVEESERSAQIVLDVFMDMMKVSYLTQSFGGPRPMNQQQIDFIDNWEVENYRRKVSKED
jgi:rhamnose utilization protein RhaD (predicted bifunctional aldolase and dehydrogenase)